MLRHGILGLLNYGDMTGYEIREIFSHSLNYFWTAQTSQIYRELEYLEKHSFAHSTLVEQSDKPNKKVFHITDSGREELLRWLTYDEAGFSMKTPLLMKVFFLGERSIEDNIVFFKSFREQIANYLNGLEQATCHLDFYASNIPDNMKAIYWEMTLDYGRRNLRLYIDWADDCIKILKNYKNDSF